jgi:predicted ATPase
MPTTNPLVLFIGAPSTGKTSMIDAFKSKGFVCFEEISRQVTQEARDEGIDHLFKREPLLFSEKLLEGRIRQYLSARSIDKPVFIDRGLPDITAYLDMFDISYPRNFLEANNRYRYDKVFWFPVWEAIYAQDSERYENVELAKTIENHLLNAYKSLDYNITEVPKMPVEDRLHFLLTHLNLK